MMEAIGKLAEITASRCIDGEEGEILEDGEIDEEEVVETMPADDIENETIIEEEVVVNDDEENSEEEEEQKKHRKKSHHRRRKRRHDDHKSEEKKSRHKKRKGEDASDGNESPPSKRKKKRKKHSKEKKDTSSPEIEEYDNSRLSESPPLPSEQNSYSYGSYDPMDPYNSSYKGIAAYDPTAPYTDPSISAYSYEAYGKEADYSSGSDSYYSDFESHLKQYQNYKQNKSTDKAASDENNEKQNNLEDDDDDDNYYSVGYDAEQREKRRLASDNQKRRTSTSRSRSEVNGDRSNNYSSRRRRSRKIPELCQLYLSESCQGGDKCNYMHEEYPCKFFHTGTQCLGGNNCKFSHESPNPDTQRIIKQFQDAFNSMDDSKEIEALEKAGLKPLDKPPPGKGLLPTPQMSMTSNKSTIPSLFDITVQPTPELQQKIDANEVACLKMSDDEMLDCPPVSLPMPVPPFPPNPGAAGPGLLPLPNVAPPGLLAPPLIPNFPPPPNLLGAPPVMLPTPPTTAIPPPILPPGSATPPWILRQRALLKQEQEEVQEFYKKFYGQVANQSLDSMQNEQNSMQEQNLPVNPNLNISVDKENTHFDDDHLDDLHTNDDKHKDEEDVIRMHEDGTVQDESQQTPNFLPAKQKALFKRIQQKGDIEEKTKSSDKDWDSGTGGSNDNWTYSSDEEDKLIAGSKSSKSSESVQSIISMISNKKNETNSAVDTNLLSKVANVINMPPDAAAVPSHSPSRPMMSPTSHPSQRKDRRGSGNDASPSHHHSRDLPVRRRLSTSELYKEAITIPLVTKHNSDTMHSSHPDPRVSLSRLFGKTRTEFRASIPVFGKDVMLPGSGKMMGLKITLSSTDSSKTHINGDKRADPRLSHSHSRTRSGDPRIKSKPNDPRLRSRGHSTTKTSPPRSSHTSVATRAPSIPPTPTALLTKPSSSIIPSLPELNLDLAPMPQSKPKVQVPPVSPASTKPGDPLARLPKLLRANVRPASSKLTQNAVEKDSQKEAPAIAPYDPRYITAGSSPTSVTSKPKSTMASSSQPAPYDPRVISSTLTSVPPLLDSRSSSQDVKKRTIQLPKLTPAPRLTPAPAYAAKIPNGNELPSGEAVDF